MTETECTEYRVQSTEYRGRFLGATKLLAGRSVGWRLAFREDGSCEDKGKDEQKAKVLTNFSRFQMIMSVLLASINVSVSRALRDFLRYL